MDNPRLGVHAADTGVAARTSRPGRGQPVTDGGERSRSRVRSPKTRRGSEAQPRRLRLDDGAAEALAAALAARDASPSLESINLRPTTSPTAAAPLAPRFPPAAVPPGRSRWRITRRCPPPRSRRSRVACGSTDARIWCRGVCGGVDGGRCSFRAGTRRRRRVRPRVVAGRRRRGSSLARVCVGMDLPTTTSARRSARHRRRRSARTSRSVVAVSVAGNPGPRYTRANAVTHARILHGCCAANLLQRGKERRSSRSAIAPWETTAPRRWPGTSRRNTGTRTGTAPSDYSTTT